MKTFVFSIALGLLLASSALALNQSYGASVQVQVTNPGAAALAEVNKLLDAKVDIEVIKAYIHNSPIAFHLTASDIIALKDRGAPPEVLKAMLEHQPQAPVASAPATPPPSTPTYVTPATTPSSAYSYPAYSYDYSYPYYYPSYYPSYSYYDYGWPYLSFSFYPRYNSCYGGYYGSRYCSPYYGSRYCYPYGSHYGSRYYGGGIRTYGSGVLATRPSYGGFHSSGTVHATPSFGGHIGGFSGSTGIRASGGFHSSGGGGGFHASPSSGGHLGGRR